MTPSLRITSVLSHLEAPTILALTLIGLFARLRGLVVPWRNLWIDETFSIWLAHHSLSSTVQVIAAIDQHPPLYALLLHFWILPRDDPWWTRLSSVILGTLAIPVAGRLGRTVGNRRVGLTAACLVTFSPVLVRYSQEVRMYSLVVLLVLVSTLFLVRALDEPVRRYWIGYGVVSVLLVYTHNIALFLLPSQAVFVLLSSLGRRPMLRDDPSTHTDDVPTANSKHSSDLDPSEARRRRDVLRSYVKTMAVVGVLWLPWAPVLVYQSAGVVQRFWISPPTPGTVAKTVLDFVNAFPPSSGTILGLDIPLGSLGVGLLVPFMVLALVGAVSERRRYGLLFLLSFAGPIAINLALSEWRPIFEERVLLYTSVGAIMLIAMGISGARSIPISLLLLAPVLWINVLSLNIYNTDFRKEQWQATASFVAQHAAPGDLILFNATWAELPFDYYYQRSNGPALVEHGLPVDLFDRGVLEPPMLKSDIPTAERLTRGRSHVWVLLSHDWYNDPQHLIRPTMRALFPRSTEYKFLDIVVIDYQR